ncbi:MAG: hypothetical protein ACXAEU_03240 [Candidatus Hodarchaeales archaeon]|jgi:hypothetical protein
MSVIELTTLNVIAIGFFGFFFGFFESATNFLYIVTNNIAMPRKQHGAELPVDVSDNDVRTKVYQMFVLGIILLTTAMVSIIADPRFFILGGLAILSSALFDAKKFGKSKMLGAWSVIAAIVIIFALL